MSDILDRPPPPFDKRITYGEAPQHFAELRFPRGLGPFPLVLMIHGGFWQSAYDLKHTGPLCADLTSRGIVTCNLEYRRIGDPGGGWPGTFQDISLASYKIPEILNSDPRVDMTRTAVMGHSAGGHLALWLVSRHRVSRTSALHDKRKSQFASAVSLAGVADLRTAWKQHLGHGIVTELIGGTPHQHPDRYDAGSPIELLPNGARQVLIHGSLDDVVPVSQSEEYIQRASQLDQECKLVQLESVGHFELIDPESDAWPSVIGSILSLLDLNLSPSKTRSTGSGHRFWNDMISPDDAFRSWMDWLHEYGDYLHNRRLELLRRLVLKRSFSSSLDIGCGAGMLKLIGVPGVVGIDVQPGPNVSILASAEHLPFRTESFQLVFAGEVIEHLRDPVSALKDWVRVLKNEGKMVVSTPNGLLVNVTGGNPDHKRMFAPDDLGRTLRRLGLKEIHLNGIFTGLVSGRRLFRRIPLRTLKTAILRIPVPVALSHNVFISGEKTPS